MVTSDQLKTIKQTFPDQPVDQQYTDQPPGDASDNTQKEQDGWQWPIDGQLTVAVPWEVVSRMAGRSNRSNRQTDDRPSDRHVKFWQSDSAMTSKWQH